MSTILERVKLFFEYKEMSARQFCKSIGVSSGYFTSAFKQHSSPSSEMLSDIIDKYEDLNSTWLLTGKGNMINEETNNTVSEPDLKYRPDTTIDSIVDEKVQFAISDFKKEIGILIHKIMEKEIIDVKNDIKNDSLTRSRD